VMGAIIAEVTPIRTATYAREQRVPELDGIRGLAILMVVVCHYFFAPGIAVASQSSVRVFAFSIFASGVDLFFVLSGFLIGGILLDNQGAPNYFKAFYGRRFCRIFPVYYGFLLVAFLLGVAMRAAHRSNPVFDADTPFWLFPAFLQNFGLSWFGDWGWFTVAVTWSLALEEQFYITLPTALRLLSKRTVIVAASAFLIAAPIIRAFVSGAPHTFGSLVLAALRGDALTAGLLCAIAVRSGIRISRKVLGIAAACCAIVVIISHLVAFPLSFLRETSLLALYSSILLIAVGGGRATGLLRSKFLCFFGTISYTLYIIHQTSLVVFHSLFLHSVPSSQNARAVAVSVAALVVSIILCKLSWDYLERPLVSWGRAAFRYH